MALAVLSNVERQRAQRALASATLSLLGGSRPSSDDAALAENVLAEVRRTLQIRDNDFTPTSTLRVREFLAQEVDESLYGDADRAALQRDLSLEARLPNGAYEITVNSSFSNLLKENPKFALKCAREALTVLHLATTLPSGQSDQGYSIYLNRSKTTDRIGHDYLTLVTATRKGTKITLANLYRVYPTAVDLSSCDTNSPEAVLKQFVISYGLELLIGGHAFPPGVIRGQRVARLPTGNTSIISEKTGSPHVLETLIKIEPSSIYVELAFAIDLNKYKADVKKFG